MSVQQVDLFNPGESAASITGKKQLTKEIWDDEPTTFLSLGGGIQSSVMLMRAIHRDIEKPDHVLFADTGWESCSTYETIDWLKDKSIEAGISFHIVRATKNGNIISIKDDMNNIPAFIHGTKGNVGQLGRQCTRDYKIDPIQRKQKELMGYKKGARIPVGRALTMIGISTDEIRRANKKSPHWNELLYPLITDLHMSRIDCQSWWDKNYPDVKLKKSACVHCPYHSDKEWLEMKRDRPHEFEQACLYDDNFRKNSNVRSELYLHPTLTPLREVNLNEKQGDSLSEQVYCSGGCGI